MASALPLGGAASRFLCQLVVHRDTTASDMTHSHLKTVPIPDEVVFRRAIIVAEYLFIQITEQVERLDVDVCSLSPRLRRLQKFSSPLVCTCPST